MRGDRGRVKGDKGRVWKGIWEGKTEGCGRGKGGRV